MNRRSAVERMGGVGMAEPMRRNGKLDAGALGSFSYNTQDGQRPKAAAADLFARTETPDRPFAPLSAGS